MASDVRVRGQHAPHGTTWNYRIQTGTSSLMGEACHLTQGVPSLLGEARPCSQAAPHLGIPTQPGVTSRLHPGLLPPSLSLV